jgi:outer membrane protein assembly factor BamD
MIKLQRHANYILPFCLLFLVVGCSLFKSAKEEPKDFNAEESLNESNRLINERYYDDAIVMLAEVISKDASRKYATVAKIRVADTYFLQELYEEAAVEYGSFLDNYPFHKYAPYAQYKLAMTYFKRIKTVDISYTYAKLALTEFQKLQRNHPRNPYMDVTENRIKMCLRILAEYEFYVGNFYYKKGSYKAAIGRFNIMLQDYPESKKESEALYLLGLSYENIGQRDKAISSLTALIDKYPTIELSIEAKEMLDSLKKTQ